MILYRVNFLMIYLFFFYFLFFFFKVDNKDIVQFQFLWKFLRNRYEELFSVDNLILILIN